MYEYELRIDLECQQIGTAAVEVWVDTQLEAGLGTERRLTLLHSKPTEWTARLEVERPMAFLYRIALRAPVGTGWALSVCALRGAGRTILADCDALTLPKEWLVGVCPAAHA